MSLRSGPKTSLPGLAATAVAFLVAPSVAAPGHVAIPLACSRGPNRQDQSVAITVPRSVARGARYTVRVDGVDSGAIVHAGLKYIHDMRSDWPVPAGATYVDGSARIVPGTGSTNVRAGARVARAGDGIYLLLPAHVDNGASYIPPSFEFELRADAPEGSAITERFGGYSVSASVFLMGDLRTSCEPTPSDFAVAVTEVVPGS